VSSAVNISLNNITIGDADISTLKEGVKLNDNIINFYAKLCNEKMLNAFVLDSLTFLLWQDGKYAKAGDLLKRSNVNLSNMDFIAVPIHSKTQQHWSLVWIDCRSKSLAHFDSYFSYDTNNSLVNIVKLGMSKLNISKFYDCTSWTHVIQKCPKQQNSFDCGIFTCLYMRCAERKSFSLPFKFDFEQNDFCTHREIICNEILNKELVSIDFRSLSLNDSSA
jgi:sentrin-specific protease 1